MFLLEYLSDLALRRLVQSATNKSERFNQFVQPQCGHNDEGARTAGGPWPHIR